MDAIIAHAKKKMNGKNCQCIESQLARVDQLYWQNQCQMQTHDILKGNLRIVISFLLIFH